MGKPKVLVIGLDCASPILVFDEFKEYLPNLSKMIAQGIHGKLRSCMPPITVPAWMVMFSGKNPGKLGLYGFRHRKGTSYTDIWIANPKSVQEPMIWDIIGKSNRNSCLYAIPPGYPPAQINGISVSCFLTPSSKSNYTYPPEIQQEFEEIIGPYIPDIDYRSGDRDIIQKELFQLLENHMFMIKYLIKSKPWDFFAFVEIGIDRVHHAFWRYLDNTHHMYEDNSKYKHVIQEFYKAIDNHIGEILDIIDKDTYILVVSDHGVKSIHGALCINEWLIKEKYMVLNDYPDNPITLKKANVNWAKTKAWAWGGYYSRVFLNVKGREKHGNVDPKDYEEELEKLHKKLLNLRDINGKKMNNIVFRPEDYYDNPKGDYPDLMVIFDDLNWRAAGTIGHKRVYLRENDIGPDDAMHDWDGLYILYDPKQELVPSYFDAKIEDIAPTILTLMGEKLPEDLDGEVINYVKQT
ncbi:MAG: alkaline phosphatase family protein [Candidatus Hodarchaeota archaeon]